MKFFLPFKSKALIFLFCCAVIIGPAYTTYDHFDFSHSIDTKSYLQMAQGDFDVTITHRYRMIVPFLAASINAPISGLYKFLWPERENKTQGLMLSFLIVNTLITSLAGLFIFLTCLEYGASFMASFISILAFLASSWTIYITGLPLVDSLYILVIALTLYGIKVQSRSALIFCILIGPFAKESFIFIAPLILLFGRNTLGLNYQLPLFLLSGIAAFSVRYFIDNQLKTPLDENLANAFTHVENILSILNRISFRGVGELFRVWGLYSFILLVGFTGGRAVRKAWSSRLDPACIGLLIAVLIHMLLSGDAGRMFYLASPVFVVTIALIVDKHPFFEKLRFIGPPVTLQKEEEEAPV